MARVIPATQSDAQRLATLAASIPALELALRQRTGTKLRRYFPETGPLNRHLYPWVLSHFAAGAQHRERGILAANRVGKTEAASYEVCCHLTGLYPPWWVGKRYPRPNHWWFAGDTMQTTRDIIQKSLMGNPSYVPKQEWAQHPEEMMLPPYLIQSTVRRTGGVANCLEMVYVKHYAPDPGGTGLLLDAQGRPIVDGISSGQFKSYDQGRKIFQGTEIDGIWLDEEPPVTTDEQSGDIYTECLLRTATTDGCLIFTFTPLRGLTRFIQEYLDTSVTAGPQGSTIPAMQRFFPDGVDALGEDESEGRA